MLEGRGLHGSLVHLIACSSSSQHLPETPQRREVSPRWSGSFSRAAGTIPMPGSCAHVDTGNRGHRASGELSLPCMSTKAATAVGTQLGISCSRRAWLACPVLGLLGVSQRFCFPKVKGLKGTTASPSSAGVPAGVTGLQDLYCGRWTVLESGQPRLWRAAQKCGLPSI